MFRRRPNYLAGGPGEEDLPKTHASQPPRDPQPTYDAQLMCEAIAAMVPELADERNEYLRTEGELFPHVYFVNVVDWCERTAAIAPLRVQALVTLLDGIYLDGDFSATNVLITSFLEGIDPLSPVVDMVGPVLRDTEMYRSVVEARTLMQCAP